MSSDFENRIAEYQQRFMDSLEERDMDAAAAAAQSISDLTASQYGQAHPAYAVSLVNLGTAVFAARHYERAAGLYKSAVDLLRVHAGEDDLGYILALESLASTHRELGRHAEAEAAYLQALASRRKRFGAGNSGILPPLLALIDFYSTREKYVAAIPLAREAQDLVRKARDERDPEVVQWFDVIASLHASAGQADAALAVLEEALAWRKRHADPTYQSKLKELAELTRDAGRLDRAAPLYRELAKHTLASDASPNPVTADMFVQAGAVYYTIDDSAEALPLFQQALHIRRAALGPHHPAVRETLDSIVALHQKMNNDAAFAASLEELVDLELQTLGPNDPEVVKRLAFLAQWHIKLQNGERAAARLAQFLGIQRQAGAIGDAGYAQKLLQVAQIYEGIGHYASATLLLEQARTLVSHQAGDLSPEAIAVVERLAGTYEQTGDYDRAEAIWRQQLERARSEPEPRPLHIARCLAHLGDVRRSAGHNDAEPLYREALAIYDRGEPPAQVLADALNGFGMLLQDLERSAEAEATFRRVLDLHRSPSSSTLGITMALVNVAAAVESQGKYSSALPLLEEARATLEASGYARHPIFATVLNNLGLLLMDLGRHRDAEPLLEKALAIQRDSLGNQHPRVAATLANLVSLHNSNGEHARAEALGREALVIQRTRLGERHSAVATTLNNLGRTLQDLARYQEAEASFLEALDIVGGTHPAAGKIDANLAGLYAEIGRYADAEKHSRRSIDRIAAIHGNVSAGYASALDRLAQIHQVRGKLTEAGPLYEEVLRIRRELLGDRHPLTAVALNNLGNWLGEIGLYTRALDLLHEAADIDRHAFGEEHPSYVSTIANLAHLYQLAGSYDRAQPILEQVVATRRRLNGENHPDVALALNNLGSLYQGKGDYVEANRCLERAVAIQLKALVSEHPQLALTLSNLGTLQHRMGNYEAALALCQTALKTQRAAFGGDHPLIAVSLNNLAALYALARDHARAAAYMQEAVGITRRALGDRHPSFARALDALSGIEHAQGHDEAALALCRQALDIRRASLGEGHPAYAESLARLASLLQARGDYQSAEPLTRDALDLTRRAFGNDHIQTAECLTDLATVYAATDRLKDAFELLQQANRAHDQMIGQVFAVGSERHRLLFLRRQQHTTDLFLTLLCGDETRGPDAVAAGFALVLRRKALALEITAKERRSVRAEADGAALEVSRRIDLLRRQIARRELDGPDAEGLDQHRTQIALWEAEREALERSLAGTVRAANLTPAPFLVEPDEIAARLPADAALVEFARINLIDSKPTLDSTTVVSAAHYLAFVLTSAGRARAEMLDLGDAETIDRLISEFLSAIVGQVGLAAREGGDPVQRRDVTVRSGPATVRTAIERATRHLSVDGGESAAPEERLRLGNRLREVVFDPVVRAAGGRDRLFVAPDGDLYRMPFEILPLDEERFVTDRYRISYLNVGRDLVRFGASVSGPPGSPMVMASPEFNLDGETVSGFSAGKPFLPLSGGRFEGCQVAQLLSVDPHLDDAVLKSVVKACRSPRVLHIATHGFFLESRGRAAATPTASQMGVDFGWDHLSSLENPLLRSGLALAGANTWLQQGELRAAAEDGLLTAEDVTGLDLAHTELVVLSACETGLGDIRAGEGVFGLRRAFLIAGARTLIMSLWKVPDHETGVLMEAFYRAVLTGASRFDALRMAQKEVRDLLVSAGRQPDPFYWGAFICEGDPGPLLAAQCGDAVS